MHKIFLLHELGEMGPQGFAKGNAQLTRQNDLLFSLFKVVYCLAR